jgi:hypothetical protein
MLVRQDLEMREDTALLKDFPEVQVEDLLQHGEEEVGVQEEQLLQEDRVRLVLEV